MLRSPWIWVSGLALAAGASWLPFAGRSVSPDEGGLLILAHQWSPGSSLYGDYFVDRPPLLIALVGLTDGPWSLRLLGIVALVVAVLLAGVLGQLAAPDVRLAPVLPAATVAVLGATPLFGGTVVNGELLGLPFLVGGLAATLASFRATDARSVVAWGLVAGVAGASGALVKQSLLDVFVCAGVLMLTRRRIRPALAIGAGAVVTVAVAVWVSSTRGTSPGELWDAVLVFRQQAAAVIAESATGTTTLRLRGMLLALVASGAPVLAVVLSRRLSRPAGGAVPDLRWPAVATLGWEVVVVLLGGSYWLHYLMGLVPGLALLAAAAVQRPLPVPRLLRTAYAVTAVSTVCTLTWVAIHPIERPERPAIAWLVSRAQPGDTAVVAFGAANILEATGLRQPLPRPLEPAGPGPRPGARRPDRAAREPGTADLAGGRRSLPRHLGRGRDDGRAGGRRALPAGGDTGRVDGLPENFSVTARTRAMTAYAALLLLWSWYVGIPNDPAGVVLWIWLGTIAWDIEAPLRSHLDFWRDWWKPLLLMVVYWLGRGLADEIGVPVHYEMPIRLDEWLSSLWGRDDVPTVALQRAWCGTPCDKTLPPRWYDVLLTTVYASHFLVSLTLAGVLYVRNRLEWTRWLRRYITLLFAGLAIYVLYPMAPPWMASRDGYLPEVHRLTSRGWSALEFHGVDLHRQTMIMFGMANKVAAMPSLHCGIACLVALYGISRLRSSPRWSALRWLLLLYPLAMALALTYFAEHYVIDAICGCVLAGLVMLGVGRWERRRAA